MKRTRALALTGTVLLALPASALAHPGHDGHDLTWDFSAGLWHPLSGWDHLVAMIAVGVWAAQLGVRARWLVPGAFVGTMALAALLGRSGTEIAGIEQGIAASLLVLGLLITNGKKLSVGAGMALAAAFASFHGYAHGAETPATQNALLYGAGFLGATALLHLVGVRLGILVAGSPRASRLIGGAIAGAGLVAMALA